MHIVFTGQSFACGLQNWRSMTIVQIPLHWIESYCVICWFNSPQQTWPCGQSSVSSHVSGVPVHKAARSMQLYVAP